jgi:hypothetical protein
VWFCVWIAKACRVFAWDLEARLAKAVEAVIGCALWCEAVAAGFGL